MVNNPSCICKHSVLIKGHRTSISIENAFWNILRHIAIEKNLSINDLISKIDSSRSGNLSSAIRLYVLEHAMS
ncbi:MAG: aryl-sulfate sulfotransferase [Magnetovibrio sp.]|nr:aryl-sulfate sulfotransferase [Magnetovibrio sp.]|tara:strand:+ start:536 stop:754 length:219 start_codon:yes stop_codon:yes gene_type:complete